MQTTKRLVWDPSTTSSKFAVAGSNEIRLLEWHSTPQSSAGSAVAAASYIKTLAVCADLPNIRTFAWSPHAQINDLVAVGLATGRTLLLRLNESNSIPLSQSSPSVTSISLNVRIARPCTTLCFAPGNLLAVGLEKARDHGLLVYDIETSARQFEKQVSSHHYSSPSPGRPAFNRSQTITPANEVRPLISLGSNESVSAAAFLHSGTHTPTLVAGMGANKWIRVFDVRLKGGMTGSTSASVLYSTRSVIGISADPFEGHRFASYGEDALIRIWDTRKVNDPLFAFAESEAGDGIKQARPAPLLNVQFSPTSRGLLMSSEASTAGARLWNITTGEKIDIEEDASAIPYTSILLSQRRAKPFTRVPHSVTFACAPNQTGTALASISKEGQIEIIRVPDPTRATLSLQSDLAVVAHCHKLPILHAQNKEYAETIASVRSVPPTPMTRQRTRTESARSVNSKKDEETTGDEAQQRNNKPNTVSNTLNQDRSTSIRDRILQGYGSNPAINASLTTDGLAKFWQWIAHAEYMASSGGKIYTEKYDFAFVGVEGILRGLVPLSAQSSSSFSIHHHRAPSRSSTPRASPSPHDGGIWQARLSASDREEKEYNNVVDRINTIHEASPYVAAASTKIMARRKLALSLCGYDFMSSDPNQLVSRLETEGEVTRAAAHAMFSGNSAQAISALRNSEDDRLKLLAPTLASHLAQQRQSTHSPADTSMFKEICGNLSSELEDAYLRAIFAYLSSSSWQDVLEEEAMALVDRLSVALRFLSDDELHRYTTRLAESAISSGDLEGLVLTGLTHRGITLIQNYVDRTGDVQTAALAASIVHPTRLADARAERWITLYRKLLDQWSKLFLSTDK